MRAPFQILAIPYKIIDQLPVFCVFHRADSDQWQFVAGGGEDNETPLESAMRETAEECGVKSGHWVELTSLSFIPAAVIHEKHRKNWDKNTYVIPEYTFAFACTEDIKLSHEHTQCIWLSYEEAMKKLEWDSNRTALYELNCRLVALR